MSEKFTTFTLSAMLFALSVGAEGHSCRATEEIRVVINLKTAKLIGLTIPPNVLARVDTVIK